MTVTYKFTDATESMLARDNQDGSITYIRVNSGSRGWNQYVESGAVAAAYVAPPEPPPLTTEQKIARAGFNEGELEDYLVAKIQLRLNE